MVPGMCVCTAPVLLRTQYVVLEHANKQTTMLGNKGTGREYRDGGCRGGADQFKWEDVKADAYRESYLGHSLHAPVGRWQKGKDIMWYTKKHGDAKEHMAAQLKRPDGGEAVRRAEIAAIKALEEDALAVELGLAVKKRRQGEHQLDPAEVTNFNTS